MSAIGSISSAFSAATLPSASSVTEKKFTTQDFMKVMVAQVSQQDPFKPTDATKFFEDMMNMSNYQASLDNTSSVGLMAKQQASVYASNLVGRYVEFIDDNGSPVTAPVERSWAKDTDVFFTANGKDYSSDRIASVRTAPTTTTTETTTTP